MEREEKELRPSVCCHCLNKTRNLTLKLEQSWIALQRKAKLYSQLQNEGDDEMEDNVLVDFVRKAVEGVGDEVIILTHRLREFANIRK